MLSLTLLSSLGLHLPAKRHSPASRCTQLAMQQPVYSADLVDENPDYTLISTTLLSQLLDVDQAACSTPPLPANRCGGKNAHTPGGAAGDCVFCY